jgi:uncharacterized membrane-anchored protein
MRRTLFVLFMVLAGAAHAQSRGEAWSQIRKLNWQFSGAGLIAGQAEIKISNGLAFLGSPDASRFIQLQGNPPRPNSYIIAPKDLRWFGAFNFDDIGYVKDNERIDPDALLVQLKEANAKDVAERKRAGLDPLYLDGWYVPPHYDVQTHRLEWGTKFHDPANHVVVNYLIKLLGRGGVMDAVLVSSPATLDGDRREFKAASTSFSFSPGHRYFEFRNGDKVAEYGLAALIVGGAAAAAAKSGALKGILKFAWVGIVAAFGAVVGWLKRLFRIGTKPNA